MTGLAEKKDIVDFVRLAQAEGVELRRSGQSYKGRCPFHPDRTPSFAIKGNHFRCFGCGAHGDVIDFIRDLRGLSFKETLSHLGITMSKPTRAERKEAKARDRERKQKRALVETFRAWESTYSTELGRRIRRAYQWINQNIKTVNDLELKGDTLAGFYKELPMWEWGLEVLACGNDEEKFRLFEVVTKHDKIQPCG